MAPPAVPGQGVLALALAGRPPREVLRAAERDLTTRRGAPPDVLRACAEALATARGPQDGHAAVQAAAMAIAQAVQRHGAAFAPGSEPPYHDRHHQAEAIIATGWLAGFARARGLLDARTALLAVAAMGGHDLLHDGSAGGPRGGLEARSADAAAAIARAAGLDDEGIAAIRRIIRATTWPWQDDEAPDLACRLAEGLEALSHRGQLDIRGIDHGDPLDVAATILGAQPVAVHRVERGLAALRAKHPVDGVAPGIADTMSVVGVTESPGLSFADPAFHAPSSKSSASSASCSEPPAKAASQRRSKSR